MALLGAGAAATLAGAKVIDVARGQLRRVYLLDALGEVVLVAAWTLAWLWDRGQQIQGDLPNRQFMEVSR